MLIGGKRYQARNGVTEVVYGHFGSPYVSGYRFRYDTGWGAKYSAPSSISSFSTYGLACVFGTGNTRLLLSGRNSTASSSYLWTQSDGYGSRSDISFSQINVFDFTEDGTAMLQYRDGAMTEYAYTAASGIGAQTWTFVPPLTGTVGGYLFDDTLLFVGVQTGFQIRLRSTRAVVSTVGGPGAASPISFSMSPLTVNNNRILIIQYDSSFYVMYEITPSGTVASTSSAVASTCCMFDSRGRLIVGLSPSLKIYTLSGFTATLLDTHTITNAGGQTIPITLSYDDDNDILFYGTSNVVIGGGGTSGGIAAVRMGGRGFISQYTAPSSPPAGTVYGIGLSYGDRWKKLRKTSNFGG